MDFVSCLLLWLVSGSINYKDYSYDEIVNVLIELNSSHPDIIELYTAQDRYGLESPGMCGSQKC